MVVYISRKDFDFEVENGLTRFVGWEAGVLVATNWIF